MFFPLFLATLLSLVFSYDELEPVLSSRPQSAVHMSNPPSVKYSSAHSASLKSQSVKEAQSVKTVIPTVAEHITSPTVAKSMSAYKDASKQGIRRFVTPTTVGAFVFLMLIIIVTCCAILISKYFSSTSSTLHVPADKDMLFKSADSDDSTQYSFTTKIIIGASVATVILSLVFVIAACRRPSYRGHEPIEGISLVDNDVSENSKTAMINMSVFTGGVDGISVPENILYSAFRSRNNITEDSDSDE